MLRLELWYSRPLIQGNHHNLASHDHHGHWHNFRHAMPWIGLIALGVGLLWMTIVHCVPRYAPMIAYALAIISLIAVGVLLLVLDRG